MAASLQRWSRGSAVLRATWAATQLTGRLSAPLSRPFVERLWFTPWTAPRSPRARTREESWLAVTEPIAVPWRDRTLHGIAAGDGPAVLLVHGWASDAAKMGAFIAPLRDAGFRVVAVDLPGHGATGGVATDIYATADAVGSVAAEVRPTAVVAHSLGSLVLLHGLRLGLDLERLALIAPAVRLSHGVSTFQRQYGIPDRAVAALRTAIERRFRAGVWEEFELDRSADYFDRPVLIVHDRDDRQVAVADALMLEAALPRASLHITQGLGHDRILRDDDVVRRVVAFLRDGEAAARRGASTARAAGGRASTRTSTS